MAPARISCAQLVWRHGESSLEKSHNSSGTDVAQAGQCRSPHCPHLSPNTPWGWSWARKKENGKRFWGERRCYCRCLGYCRVLPKRRRREGERQWGKGNICQALEEADGGDGQESACGMSPVQVGLVPSLGRFLSAPALGHHIIVKTSGCSVPAWGLWAGQGPVAAQGGVPGVWQHRPSSPSVLCPGRHPARAPVSPCQEAQLPPELSPGREPSPARTGRGTQ